MRGAEALLRTLVGSGVNTCFMNPGTSEMHFVAALDDVPEMRGVLALFEGVATGAADGYARMAGRPAACLLHLGPGLANGIANLHNARRAASPVVVVVGDHATYHKAFDAPLESDIDSLAANFSCWTGRPSSASVVGELAAEAVGAAMAPPGGAATLILPADASWSEGASVASGALVGGPSSVDPEVVESVAEVLRQASGTSVAFLVGGEACRAEALAELGRICAGTGARLINETFPARLERGAGVVATDRLAYLGEMAVAQLSGFDHLILVGARSPVSFFAYPGRPSDLVPESVQVHTLCRPGEDTLGAISSLAESVPTGDAVPAESWRPEPPTGPLTAAALGQAVGATLPEGAIVCDEANTSGLHIAGATAGCPPHDWLTLTGGSIGIGLPLAVGAAVACPDRKVIALQADGAAMYTAQALWTMAREGLDITVVVAANRSYAILNMELQRVGASGNGARAREMLDIGRPDIDFVALAASMGVPGRRPENAADLHTALREAFAQRGPYLVEAVIVR